MITIENNSTLTGEVRSPVTTTAVSDAEIASSAIGRRAWKEAWQEVIDHRLIDWGRNPSQLDDDGIIPPSAAAIQGAIRFAEMMRDTGQPPPTRIVPSGEGGVVFELVRGSFFHAVEIRDDRSAEFGGFKNSRLIERRQLHF